MRAEQTKTAASAATVGKFNGAMTQGRKTPATRTAAPSKPAPAPAKVGKQEQWQNVFSEAMRDIPYGETATYGEVAALAGHPNAQRASGSVCASNRFPLIVPCHRVVAAGGLGSYGSLGVGYKRRLLELEHAVL